MHTLSVFLVLLVLRRLQFLSPEFSNYQIGFHCKVWKFKPPHTELLVKVVDFLSSLAINSWGRRCIGTFEIWFGYLVSLLAVLVYLTLLIQFVSLMFFATVKDGRRNLNRKVHF